MAKLIALKKPSVIGASRSKAVYKGAGTAAKTGAAGRAGYIAPSPAEAEANRLLMLKNKAQIDNLNKLLADLVSQMNVAAKAGNNILLNELQKKHADIMMQIGGLTQSNPQKLEAFINSLKVVKSNADLNLLEAKKQSLINTKAPEEEITAIDDQILNAEDLKAESLDILNQISEQRADEPKEEYLNRVADIKPPAKTILGMEQNTAYVVIGIGVVVTFFIIILIIKKIRK